MDASKKFGKMTGRVEFRAIASDVGRMVAEGYSVKCIFNHFARKGMFSQTYSTFLRYARSISLGKLQFSAPKPAVDRGKNVSSGGKSAMHNEDGSKNNKRKIVSMYNHDKLNWEEFVDDDDVKHIIACPGFGQKFVEKITNEDGKEVIVELEAWIEEQRKWRTI